MATPMPGTPLRVGSTGIKVKEAQFYLYLLSAYYPSIPRINYDGIFGTATRNAVIAFQQIAGLTADGIIGPATWQALYSTYEKLRTVDGPVIAYRFDPYPGNPVAENAEGQAVCERWVLVGPAEGDRGHGHHQPGQLKRVDDHLRHVYRGAEETQPEALFFSKIAESLREEQRVGGGVDEREEVVVARLGLAAAAPAAGAVEVGAHREHHGRFGHHRLVEMRGRELGLHLCRARHYDAVKLHVAHCLRARRLGEKPVEQFVRHFPVRIFPYTSSCVYILHTLYIL